MTLGYVTAYQTYLSQLLYRPALFCLPLFCSVLSIPFYYCFTPSSHSLSLILFLFLFPSYRRALDLIFVLVDETNSEEVVGELVITLSSAQSALKEDMVVKIAILAEKYSPGAPSPYLNHSHCTVLPLPYLAHCSPFFTSPYMLCAFLLRLAISHYFPSYALSCLAFQSSYACARDMVTILHLVR